jgi:hypothetical protein
MSVENSQGSGWDDWASQKREANVALYFFFHSTVQVREVDSSFSNFRVFTIKFGSTPI